MPDLTVKELAARERVVEKTVRRWIDKGAVVIRRTPGGGIRIPYADPGLAGAVIRTSVDKRGHSSD